MTQEGPTKPFNYPIAGIQTTIESDTFNAEDNRLTEELFGIVDGSNLKA